MSRKVYHVFNLEMGQLRIRTDWAHLLGVTVPALAASNRKSLAQSARRHRSNLMRSIRRALTWQFIYLSTAPWRWGRLKRVPRFAAPYSETLPEELRRLNRSPPPRSSGRPHPVASDNDMAHVRSRIFLHACHPRLVNAYRSRTLIPIRFSYLVPGPSISKVAQNCPNP